jgi:hypothetical protein
MSISKIIVNTLKKYSYILQKDFTEITNILPKKRKIFISNGIKIFMKNVEKEIENFQLDIDFFFDTNLFTSILDINISMEIKKDILCEYIVFNPIKMHFFYTYGNNLFFNDKKISFLVENENKLVINSKNPLFVHNIYLCYLLLGTFKEIVIYQEHLEINKFAINILNKIIKEEIVNEGIRFTIE